MAVWGEGKNNTNPVKPKASWSGATPPQAQGENPWNKNVFETSIASGLPSTESKAFKPYTGQNAIDNLRTGTMDAQSNLAFQGQGQTQDIWNDLASRGGIRSDEKDRIASGINRQVMAGQQDLRGMQLQKELEILGGAEKFNQEYLADLYNEALKHQASINQSREIAGKDQIPYGTPGGSTASNLYEPGGDFSGADPKSYQEFKDLGYELKQRNDGMWFWDTKGKTKFKYNIHWNPETQKWERHYYGDPDNPRKAEHY